MYIKKVQIDNFGKFHQKSISFMPGLNVVYGENESGKSTLHSFLKGMLYGMEKQRGRAKEEIYKRYEPWNSPSYYSGKLEFCVGAKDFVLERNFYHKEKYARLYNPAEQEELSVAHGDLEMLLGGMGKYAFENTCCIPQAAVITEADFARKLQQELSNAVYGGGLGIDIGQAQQALEKSLHKEEQKLKHIQQQKAEEEKRLEWEQELVKADILQLQEQINACRSCNEQEEHENKRVDGTENRRNRCFWFRIPILGRLLQFLAGIFRKKKKATESTAELPKQQKGIDEILQEQLMEKQMRLSNLKEQQEEGSHLRTAEQGIQSEIKSIRLAIEIIKDVAKECSRTAKTDVIAGITGIFRELTDGAYDRIDLSSEGGLLVWEKDKCLQPWQLSRGTMEQLYLSLRLGAGRYMMQEEKLPLLLDETFCAYDDVRLERTLSWLASWKEQVILFTCQTRELSMLDEMELEHHRVLL